MKVKDSPSKRSTSKQNQIAALARVYESIPKPFRRAANNLRILPSYLHWRWADAGRQHAEAILRPLENSYAGHRCVVIGNGPSLKNMDLTVLREEFTFGLNRIYLLFDELGFETDFLVAINRFVMHQFAQELALIGSLKILNWLHREQYAPNPTTLFLSAKPSERMKGSILNGYFSGGGTVTNVALELAYFLGFSEVILIGVDHSYRAQQGLPGEPVVSKSEDVNHFHPAYFGPGAVWQLPNFDTMEHGFIEANRLFSSDERIVVDATVQGKLQVFPKVEFENYLVNSTFKSKCS